MTRVAIADRHEIELKLLADDAAPLEALTLAEALGPAQLGPAAEVDELDRYLDTADGRLAALRWACRLRTREGRTIVSLKGPAAAVPDAFGLHRRPELEGPALPGLDPPDWPPSTARDRLGQLTAGAALREQLTLRQRRTERSVSRRGRRLGLLTLDRVEVVDAGGHGRGRLFVVELELGPAAAADTVLVAELGAALSMVPGLVPDPKSKLEHALALVSRAAAGSGPGG